MNGRNEASSKETKRNGLRTMARSNSKMAMIRLAERQQITDNCNLTGNSTIHAHSGFQVETRIRDCQEDICRLAF